MSASNNKSRDRKPNDRRNHEERRPVVSSKPIRSKRWKDMYESGALGEDDALLDDDLSLFEDEEDQEDEEDT